MWCEVEARHIVSSSGRASVEEIALAQQRKRCAVTPPRTVFPPNLAHTAICKRAVADAEEGKRIVSRLGLPNHITFSTNKWPSKQLTFSQTV